MISALGVVMIRVEIVGTNINKDRARVFREATASDVSANGALLDASVCSHAKSPVDRIGKKKKEKNENSS